ncbi:MAG: dTMP kinase [Candidatus Paceibacteria bacterium]
MSRGTFIMVDGIDGAGKTTIIEEWKDFLQQKDKSIFDLKSYWHENHTHPISTEISDFDVIFSAEPTSVWTGAAIREEMINENTQYSARSIAKAFSLDRLVLYKRVLLKALNQGVDIIQDRGVSTSLCYQPLQADELMRDDVAQMEGNRFTLNNRPDYLVIADVDPEQAIERLYTREQSDNSIFEKKKFLHRARETFFSKDYQELFTKEGAEIKKLNSGVNIDTMKRNSVSLLKNILNLN